MAYNWHAKVHKTGTKVAIFDGLKLVKVVESSKETFEPAEAQKFAEKAIEQLKEKTSAQMTSPCEQPSTTSEAELQNISMSVATQQATGGNEGKEVEEKGSDFDNDENGEDDEDDEKLASENTNLKKIVSGLKTTLAKERNERIIERKARRGLAIAKQLVNEGVLEDSYETIKNKVAEIVKLEESEIERLERKIAGEHEFVSVEDAQKELRRQSRISRINRQAAAEAQEDNDEEEADKLDRKADEAEAKVAHIQQVILDMSKTAESDQTNNEKQKTDTTVATNNEEQKTAEDESTQPTEKETTEPEEKTENSKPDEEPKEQVAEPEKTSSNEQYEKLSALAKEYRTIAANHRKLAEVAESNADIETADAQDAMGDEAEEKAENIEEKLAEMSALESEKNEEPEEKADENSSNIEEQTEENKESTKKEPGNVVTSSKHSVLKREDGAIVEESFGIDKNASLVEENDYSNDPEVEILSKMWRSVPKNDE